MAWMEEKGTKERAFPGMKAWEPAQCTGGRGGGSGGLCTGGRGGGSAGLRGQAPWDHLKKAPNARRQPHQQPAQCWEMWAAARVEGLCGTPDLVPRKL